MTVHVDIWLRGTDFATTQTIEAVTSEPAAWTDDDVRRLLEEMLRALSRAKSPERTEETIALRGLSWIVNPFEDGGVVIAIEISLGAAIAGPFAIDRSVLEAMIGRVLARPAPASPTVH